MHRCLMMYIETGICSHWILTCPDSVRWFSHRKLTINTNSWHSLWNLVWYYLHMADREEEEDCSLWVWKEKVLLHGILTHKKSFSNPKIVWISIITSYTEEFCYVLIFECDTKKKKRKKDCDSFYLVE